MKLRLKLLVGILLLALIVSVANGQEVGVSPDPLPPINEGEKTTFSVTVKNVGTEGTISASAQSDHYSFTPLTQTSRNFEAGETFTFRWEAHALNVEEDRDTTIEILVQGCGGSDTYTLNGKILDVEGYSPVNPDETDTITSFPWAYLAIASLAIIGVVSSVIIWKRKKKSE